MCDKLSSRAAATRTTSLSSTCQYQLDDSALLCQTPPDLDSVIDSVLSPYFSPRDTSRITSGAELARESVLSPALSVCILTRQATILASPSHDISQSRWKGKTLHAVLWIESCVQDALRKVQSVNLTHSFDAFLPPVALDTTTTSLFRCALFRTFHNDSIVSDLQIRPQESIAPSVWFVVSGMGAQFPGMAAPLMDVPIFAATIEQCASGLIGTGVDLVSLVTDTSPATAALLQRPEYAFVAVVAVHIALIETLASLGVAPSGYLGHSVGELTCAYLSGFLTLKQTLQCAYGLGLAASACPGAMAAVNISRQHFESTRHEGISLACENSHDSITVAGSSAAVTEYVVAMKRQGALATVVDSAGVAFHSSLLNAGAPAMRSALARTMGLKSHARPAAWVSTSTRDASTRFSAEYLVQNLIKPSLFASALERVPANAVVIEIGATPILSSSIKSAKPRARCVVAPMSRKFPSKLTLTSALAEAFTAGGIDVQHIDSLAGEHATVFERPCEPLSRGDVC